MLKKSTAARIAMSILTEMKKNIRM